MRPDVRSFSDPDTEFEIIREIQPVGPGGCTALRPTGEVRCLGECDDGDVCGRVAAAPEYIPHRPGCDQADVVSKFYAEIH